MEGGQPGGHRRMGCLMCYTTNPTSETAIPALGSSQHLLSWTSAQQGFVPPQTHKKRLEPGFPTLPLQTLPPPLMEQKTLGKKMSDSFPAWKKLCPTNSDWCPRTDVLQNFGFHEQFTNSRAWTHSLGSEQCWACKWKYFPTMWHWAMLCLRLTFPILQYHLDCPWKRRTASQGHLRYRGGLSSPCHMPERFLIAINLWDTLLLPQLHLSNWPGQFLGTPFSTLWAFQTSWKLAWGPLVLRITSSLKVKLRLGSYFETTPVSREFK